MLSAYLVRMIENHAEDLTREVLDDLTQNPRTPAWHSLSRDEIHRRVYDLYHNLGLWLADNSEESVERSLKPPPDILPRVTGEERGGGLNGAQRLNGLNVLNEFFA